MTDGPTEATRAVFRLPPPSTSRLVLLGTSLGAFALFTASWATLGTTQPDSSCLDAAGAAAVLDCTGGPIAARGALLLAAPVLLAVLAVAGAGLVPFVLTRFGRIVPVPADAAARPALDRLAAGLPRAPEWYQPDTVRTGAWTFGYGRRHCVVVDVGAQAALVSGKGASVPGWSRTSWPTCATGTSTRPTRSSPGPRWRRRRPAGCSPTPCCGPARSAPRSPPVRWDSPFSSV
ncbi:hypothetical protein BJF78_24855 [Pseudonocardia sp. CNS-139]|nr:hypothetical protein BJF78_24855 [Pseudonocardia sp. CNS-139]